MSLNFLERKLLGLFVKTNGLISKPFFGGKGVIVSLHRIITNEFQSGLFKPLSLGLSHQSLERIILFFKSNNYKFLSIDDALDYKGKERFVVFTLDDGYWDNFEFGLPVFEKYNVPFTIYLTTHLIENKLCLWWYNLENWLLSVSKVSHPITQEVLEINSTRQKKIAFNLYRDWFISASSYQDLLNKKKKIPSFSNYNSLSKNAYALSKHQIKKLNSNELVTFGAHTSYHLALSKLNDKDCKKEINDSKEYLENLLGKEINHFAYPFGSENECGEREFFLVKELGFKSAMTLYHGVVNSRCMKNKFSLPRVPMNDKWDEKKLKDLANGIYEFSYNGFKQW